MSADESVCAKFMYLCYFFAYHRIFVQSCNENLFFCAPYKHRSSTAPNLVNCFSALSLSTLDAPSTTWSRLFKCRKAMPQ